VPRLVLYDDDGRELFAGDVSESNVQIVARFLRRNMGALHAAAAFKKSLEGLGELLGPLLDPKRRGAPPRKPAPRARGARR
jgi:hypothetical protein